MDTHDKAIYLLIWNLLGTYIKPAHWLSKVKNKTKKLSTFYISLLYFEGLVVDSLHYLILHITVFLKKNLHNIVNHFYLH